MSRSLPIALWVVQVLLALVFAGAGAVKVALPLSQFDASGLPGALVRFIGVAEISGALGLILPALFRVAPVLTPLAAVGLHVIMWLATAYHMFRGEWSSVPVTVVIGALAGFAAWGRLKRAPIRPRGGQVAEHVRQPEVKSYK